MKWGDRRDSNSQPFESQSNTLTIELLSPFFVNIIVKNRNNNIREQVALILAKGAVALVLIIAIGAFGRAFYITVVTGVDHHISEPATQLLTALGSALVGGAVGYISGVMRR